MKLLRGLARLYSRAAAEKTKNKQTKNRKQYFHFLSLPPFPLLCVWSSVWTDSCVGSILWSNHTDGFQPLRSSHLIGWFGNVLVHRELEVCGRTWDQTCMCACVRVSVSVCPCVLAAFVFLSQFYIPALRGECFLWVPLLFFNIYLTFCLSSDYWNDCKLVWNNRLLQSFVSEKNMMTSTWNTILQMVFLLFLYVSAVHSSQLYSWDDNKIRFIKAFC